MYSQQVNWLEAVLIESQLPLAPKSNPHNCFVCNEDSKKVKETRSVANPRDNLV